MECVEKDFDTPEESIAFDELLLTEAEQGQKAEMLRFWEVEDYVVILGRGASAADDVYIDRCRKDKIKILKRISGGGTVLLGKGCLNYSLLLPYNMDPDLLNIKSSYKYILEKVAAAFYGKGINLAYYPVSDLVFSDRKVSGNAQARKRKFLLHHGTFLYDFDIDKIGFYLKEPKKAPEYRKSRPHKDFLTNLPLSLEEIKEIVKTAFRVHFPEQI